MADLTYNVILNNVGIRAFTIPPGYWPDVEIHCWGAGGGTGWGGASGGGGGYAKTTINVSEGDEISLQIGQPGKNAPSASTGGEGGVDPTYRRFRGGNGGTRGGWCGNVNGPYPSGGGGGASWVALNGTFVCVGAGGGGGGGYGHKGVKYAGNPGGVYTSITNPAIYKVSLTAWGSFLNTYGVWGGGQDYSVVINFPTSGTYTFKFAVDNYGSISLDGTPVISLSGTVYSHFTTTTTETVSVSAGNHTIRVRGFNTGGPAGVGAQILNPDDSELWNTRALLSTPGLTTTPAGGDATYGGGGGGGYLGGASGYASGHAVIGGNGGLNYGDVTAAGSGNQGAGKNVSFYPGKNIGNAGFAGYIVIKLRKKIRAFVKNADGSGDWNNIEAMYTKVPGETVSVGGSSYSIVASGWKQIQAAWTKVNGQWEPILTNKPIDLYNYPTKRLKANIIISSDTNDYNLYNNIPTTYFEGLLDVDVWVLPNVVVTGNTTSTAFTISGFDSRDTVRLHNYGVIQGRGGNGGSGSYTYTTRVVSGSKSSGSTGIGYTYNNGKGYSTTRTAAATAGGSGGTGLLLTSQITLLNNGVIAGGGGGGGGGTSSGRGGGGAGYGTGYNNGTLTAGGAGGTGAGAGGARGQAGSAGSAAGGAAGYAIQGNILIIPGTSISGTTIGPVAG